MGMDDVARWAARTFGGATATITSTLRRTRSAASCGARSMFPSVYRRSMMMFRRRRTDHSWSGTTHGLFGTYQGILPMIAFISSAENARNVCVRMLPIEPSFRSTEVTASSDPSMTLTMS
jgi:hypothetical protein